MKRKYRILEIMIDTDNCEITLIDRNGKPHKIHTSQETCSNLDMTLGTDLAPSSTYRRIGN